MEYGETISRTGSMIVRSDAPISVSQDGVEWVPVGLVDGAPQYVLGSAGRVSVSVNGREVFFFTVVLSPDFTFNTNNMRQLMGSEILENTVGRSSYCQSRFLENADNVTFTLGSLSLSIPEVQALETACNQEDITVRSRVSGELLVYEIGNINTSTYFQFFVGNVLLGFIAPVN